MTARKSEQLYLSETNENWTFCSGDTHSTWGRFNSNKMGNSNYNNRSARQRQYYINNNSGNQTIGNKDKWGCKTNPLNNNDNISKCTVCLLTIGLGSALID